MDNMQSILQAAATIFALVNPAVCVGMFLGATKGLSKAKHRVEATKVVLAILIILLVAAFAGTLILNAFGISIPAFSVAGGAILGVIGVQMMLSGPEKDDGKPKTTTSLIIFAASPGTITGVITIAAAQSATALPINALGGIAVVMVVLWVLLMIASGAVSKTASKPGLGSTLMTKYMGLIVIAMGVQFMLSGWQQFMAG